MTALIDIQQLIRGLIDPTSEISVEILRGVEDVSPEHRANTLRGRRHDLLADALLPRPLFSSNLSIYGGSVAIGLGMACLTEWERSLNAAGLSIERRN